MDTSKIHFYLVPGLAASAEIFRNISFPSDTYEIHILDWLIPEKKESLAHYAERMATKVVHSNTVLVGVSFGGVLAQEMSAFLTLKNLIIISSVKTRNELPKRLRFARKTLAYKLVPTGLILSATDLRKFAIGPRSRKRLSLYQEYLSVRNKTYLDWAIKNMVCWERTEAVENVIHIHGDKDIVFPIKNIKEYILLPGGTHVMIIHKGKWLSNKLLELIEK